MFSRTCLTDILIFLDSSYTDLWVAAKETSPQYFRWQPNNRPVANAEIGSFNWDGECARMVRSYNYQLLDAPCNFNYGVLCYTPFWSALDQVGKWKKVISTLACRILIYICQKFISICSQYQFHFWKTKSTQFAGKN